MYTGTSKIKKDCYIDSDIICIITHIYECIIYMHAFRK